MSSLIDHFMTQSQVENCLEHLAGLGSLTADERAELKRRRHVNSRKVGALGAAAGGVAAGTVGATTGGVMGTLFAPGAGTFAGTVFGLDVGVMVGAAGGAVIGSVAGDVYSIARFALERKYMREKQNMQERVDNSFSTQ